MEAGTASSIFPRQTAIRGDLWPVSRRTVGYCWRISRRRSSGRNLGRMCTSGKANRWSQTPRAEFANSIQSSTHASGQQSPRKGCTPRRAFDAIPTAADKFSDHESRRPGKLVSQGENNGLGSNEQSNIPAGIGVLRCPPLSTPKSFDQKRLTLKPRSVRQVCYRWHRRSGHPRFLRGSRGA